MKRCGAWLVAVLLLAGCVSTPERRIARNAELFATFPAEVQVKIRQGQVEVGFTPAMTRLALGDPRRIHSRTTAAGETEIWIYTGVAYDSTLEPYSTAYWYRDRHGRLRRAYDMGWIPMDHVREYPILRVEFEGGAIKAIEKAR